MRRGSGRGRANGRAARCRVARSLAVLPVPSVHRTVLMRIRQPFGSPEATYPQLRFIHGLGVGGCKNYGWYGTNYGWYGTPTARNTYAGGTSNARDRRGSRISTSSGMVSL